jgi:NFU1 iron-sulfur cluster scaffold homolog, mitochondrial
VDWPHLKAPILAAVMDHFTSGRPLLTDAAAEESDGHDDTVYEGETAQIVAEIKDLLDTRIRPAVAQDGGDIVFSRFAADTGVVYLHMRGACSGCPSSSATLKSGVENMLRHYVPEVTAVEQVL